MIGYAPSGRTPYYEGYLDAAGKGTYILSDGIARMPIRRFGPGSTADLAWMVGVMEYAQDSMAVGRASRTSPPWRLI